MVTRPGSFAVAAVLLVLPGCACPWGSCRTTDGNAARPGREQESVATADTAQGADETAAAIGRNLTDAEILVDEVELREGKGYVLKGTLLSATPAGSRASIAETGQRVSLTPWFPGGTPDLSSPAHRRLMELSASPRGSKVRCRIALDNRGAWRIISAE